MNKEDKIMDKVNKNLNIINDLLMENDFYKYINKLVTIEDCISQLYDDYKLLKVQNQKYKEVIDKIRCEFLKYDWKTSNNTQIYNQLSEIFKLLSIELDILKEVE